MWQPTLIVLFFHTIALMMLHRTWSDLVQIIVPQMLQP
jgi:hypothetical protein